MKSIRFSLALLLSIFLQQAFSQSVFLSEVCYNNFNAYTDENGDDEDWIELYNPHDTAVSLADCYLSDKADELHKWKFPKMSLQPGQRFIVFASGKDRKQLCNHWEMLLQPDTAWRYKCPNAELPYEWNMPGFDDASWNIGKPGFGFGDGDDSTLVGDTVPSIFIRRSFELTDTSNMLAAVLGLDFDDSFVAYLNGFPIAWQGNYQNDRYYKPSYNTSAIAVHEALMYQGLPPEMFFVPQNDFLSHLNIGTNTLAIQVHNFWGDDDMSAIPYFFIAKTDSTIENNPVPEWFEAPIIPMHTSFKLGVGESLVLSNDADGIIDSLYMRDCNVNTSFGRHSISKKVFFFKRMTPGTFNADVIASFIHEQPLFDIPAGFYKDRIRVTISKPDTSCLIKYTLDGSDPDNESSTYTEPLIFKKNTVLKARLINEGKMPGKINTASYLVNENAQLDVVSLSFDSLDFFSVERGIYVKGVWCSPSFPFYGANFWKDWERKVHVEIFDKQDGLIISQDVGAEIHGGWSRGFPMKTLRLKSKSKLGESSFDYPLFSSKQNIAAHKRILLRNAGNDFWGAYMRDVLIHRSIGESGRLDVMADRPVVVLFNGAFWGVHYMREKFDRYYLVDNFGYREEDICIIERQGEEVEGTNHDFLEMVDYLLSHDLSDSIHYHYADSAIDINNMCDYFATELFSANVDWPHNNIKMWKNANGKWHYFLYDLDVSMAYHDENGFGLDAFGRILSIDELHAHMFKALLANKEFRHKFINHYADMLNTVFRTDVLLAHIDSLVAELSPDMERHFDNWVGNMANWIDDNIEDRLKGFVVNRPNMARKNIIRHSEAVQSHDIAFRIIPRDAANIQLNSLTLNSFPWNGLYFEDIPIQLEALPERGYAVDHWESSEYGLLSSSGTLSYNPKKEDVITLYLVPSVDSASVIFTEINYKSHPDYDAGDWVELHNPGNIPMDIGRYVFKDDKDSHQYVFSDDAVLYPKEYIVLANDPGAFISVYPVIDDVFGPFDFGLGSSADEVRLFDAEGLLVSEIQYTNSLPWPDSVSGTGRTMEIVHYSGGQNTPENWKNGCFLGSPASEFFPCDTLQSIDEETGLVVNIHPNPAHEYCNILIKTLRAQDISCDLMDIRSGVKRNLFQKYLFGEKVFPVNLSGLPSGIYLLKIQMSDNQIVKKLIIL